jgi:hypothetical protein
MGRETEYALRLTFSVTVPAGGTATLTFGPAAAYTRWKLTRYSVVAVQSSASVISGFTLYRGALVQQQVIDFTQQGWGDTSSANDVELYPGEICTAVWTNLLVGSTAQITIEGSNYVKGQRSY